MKLKRLFVAIEVLLSNEHKYVEFNVLTGYLDLSLPT